MNIDEIDITKTVSYFDPSAVQTKKLIGKRSYPCHITECIIKEVAVRKKYKAKVFNLKLEVAEECGGLNFEDDNGNEISGKAFVGSKISATGIFLFLNPQEGDDFESNNGGNESYVKFCKSIGHNPKEVEIEVDGEKRNVFEFPTLSKEDVINKPVMAWCDYETWKSYKDGKNYTTIKAKGFNLWEEGKNLTPKEEDLPF